MLNRSLLRRLLTSAFFRTPTTTTRKRISPFGLVFEQLEDRVVPYQGPTSVVTYVSPSPIGLFNESINYAQEIQGATVSIVSGLVPSEDQLLFTNPTGIPITSSYNATTGILTLSGVATGIEWQQILEGVQYNDIASNPSTGDRSIFFQLGQATYFPDTGHYYQFINTAGRPSLSWDGASSDASSRIDLGLTGYLATVTSQAEQNFISNLVGGSTIWLGGSDSRDEETWRWATGPEGTQQGGVGLEFYDDFSGPVGGQYNNWSSSYPFGSSSANYLAMSSNGQWINVIDSYGTTGYVVEYGGLGTTPNFVDQGYTTVHVLDRTASPSVTLPATATTAVNAASYTITGTAPANSLVQVFVDANDDGIPDNPNSPVATQQLSNGATSFSISTPLTQDAVNDFVVLATAYSGANPSLPQEVPTINENNPATHLVLNAPSQAIPGGLWSVSVDAADMYDSIDPFFDGSIALSLSAGPAGSKLAGDTLATVVNGMATFNNLSLNLTGTYTLFAASASDLLGASSDITVSATTHFGLSSTTLSTMAGESIALTVKALNALGKVDANYRGAIHFSSTDVQAGLPADYTFVAGDNGVHTFAVTLKTAGSSTISVADTTKAAARGTSPAIKVSAASLQGLKVSGYPTVDVMGVAHPVTVTAVDAFGNRVTSYRGAIHFTSSDSQAVLPANYTFTAADNGAHTFSITLKSQGSQSLTATDTVTSSIAGTQAAILVVSPTTHFRVTSVPTATTAGQSVNITVTALNALDQTDTLFSDTVHFTSSDPQAVLPTDYTFVSGDNGSHTFTVTLKTAGSRTVTVADTIRPTLKLSSIITVTPAAANLFKVAGYPASLVSGTTGSFTVTAVDAFGNRATGYRGTIHLTSSDALAVLPANYTFTPANNGIHVFSATLKTPGVQTLTATDTVTSTLAGTQGGIEVTPATTRFSITGVPTKTTSGIAFTSVTVRALDALGQVDTLFQGTIHFTSTDLNALLPADYTFQPDDNGSKTFAVTFTNVGSQTITATDTARAVVKGTSTASTVSLAGAAPSLTAGLAGPAVGVRGQPLVFTLTASQTGQPVSTVFTYKIDWDGNGTVDQTVTGTSGLTITHVYPATGNFNAKVTVVGTTGKASTAAIAPVAISAVALEGNDLYIGGTTGADTIVIAPVNNTNGQTVAVTINNVLQAGGPFTPAGNIIVYSQAGTDTVKLVTGTISSQTVSVAIPAIIFGGSGNHTFSAAGSSANNVLIGGTGANNLTAGSGRDILIGGTGSDSLHGGSGDDLLISGETTYDTNLAALLVLSAEWSRTDRTYQERVQDLFGDGSGGLNGTFLLNSQTVVPDTAINQLFGGSGNDWFWLQHSTKLVDGLTGYTSGEVTTFE